MSETTIVRRASPNFGRRTRGAPRFVVIHATVGGLEGTLRWLTSPQSRVSAHYVVAKDGAAYQLVPEERVAWHAGQSFWRGVTDLNQVSIGIELVNRNDGLDPYPASQYAGCAEIVAAACHRWQIPVDRSRIVGHYEVAPRRKTDPRGFDLFRLVVEASRILNG